MVEGSGLCFDFPDFDEVGLMDVECAWYSGTWDSGNISSVGTTEADVDFCSGDTGCTLETELEWDREQEVCI